MCAEHHSRQLWTNLREELVSHFRIARFNLHVEDRREGVGLLDTRPRSSANACPIRHERLRLRERGGVRRRLVRLAIQYLAGDRAEQLVAGKRISATTANRRRRLIWPLPLQSCTTFTA
ncbi:hypothetical protein [Burkholderia pyrrocinia]|uniref:hypothetical protein n=1 Tax=Burkholderia pyrrocinia TaxID=60550 RepID=UPI001BD0A17C|nr:hypothetical protein [Burkholderia pyrrocinia]QVN18269.1 hypothetical protein JYG32_00560 [Burkholderia pyrrocinia]